jgi:DNA polymerase III sliding clamp (beta) subunit (PCNA family)
VLLKETGRRDSGAPRLFVKDIIPAASLRGKVASVNPPSSAVQFNKAEHSALNILRGAAKMFPEIKKNRNETRFDL